MSPGINVNKRDNDNAKLSSTVKKYRKQLEDLPEPGEWWQMCEVDNQWINRRSTYLREAGIISKVGERIHEPSNKHLNVYKTTRMGWQWLEHYRNMAKRNRVLPCSDEECPGCSFRNPRDVDGIVCKDCNEVHNPDDI